MKIFRNTAPVRQALAPVRQTKFQAAEPHKAATSKRKAAVFACQTLLVGLVSLTLLATPVLLSACSSQKNLCPAYNQHIKREALPY